MSVIPRRETNAGNTTQQTEISLVFGKDSVKVGNCTTRNITQKIIENQFINPRSEIYFIHIFNINIDCWESIYQIPLRATIDTKLREFQFKILHNIVITNSKLFKMTPPKVGSAKCTFCESEEETMLHLFCRCHYVDLFWEGLFMLWGGKVGLLNRLQTWQIILGDESLSCLVNFLILLAKRYIYISRCKKVKPDFLAFKRYVKTFEKTEFLIAERKNKLKSYCKKWRKYKENIQDTSELT